MQCSIKQHSVRVLCYTDYSDILHVDKQNADAVYVRGMCLYYQDNVERAFSHFQHVLRLAPDHQKAMDIYKVYFKYLNACIMLLLIVRCVKGHIVMPS
jgi:tetratricopeptide (TPR) repeat protein